MVCKPEEGELTISTYEDILNESWDNIPQPLPLPVGSYLLVGRNATYQPAKAADKSDAVLFVYGVKEAMEDVDQDQLDELGDDYDLGNNTIFHRIYVETSVDWDRVREHLSKHGVEPKGSIGESLKAFKNTNVVGFLSQRSYTTNAGEAKVDNNVTAFVPVE